MTENDINRKISQEMAKQLGPDYWFCKNSDRSTSGIPDFSVMGFGRYSGWEVKYANPDFKLPGIQLLTCQRLDRVSFCRFVIFSEAMQMIKIVVPAYMDRDRNYSAHRVIEGFDYEALVKHIQEAHEL